MKVSGAIKSVIHGVTTNSLNNADSAYFDTQTNTIPRIDEGLTKRPPLEWLNNIGATLGAGEFVKPFIIHDTAYFLVVRKSPFTMTVTRDDGLNYTVTDSASDGYLDTVAADELKLTVHGELVFLLNKTKTVVMTPAADSYPQNSLLFIKGPIEQGATVKVTAVNVANNKVQKTITVGSTLIGTAPDVIAAQVNTAFAAEADWTCSNRGGVVQFVRSDGAYSQVTAESDIDDHNLIVMNGEVSSFDDLPKHAYQNCRQSVKPANVSEGDPVYMKAVAESFKDEELAVADPTKVYPTHDFNVTLAWWKYDPTTSPFWFKLAGAPTDENFDHYLQYQSTDAGATDYLVYDTSYRILRVAVSFLAKDVGGSIDLNNAAPYWRVEFVPTYSAPSSYLLHHWIRFSETGTPQVTISEIEVEDWGSTSGSDPGAWTNFGYFLNPYGAATAAPLITTAGTYSCWLDELGALPAVTTFLIEVKWIEVAANDIEIDLDASTMPHLLAPADSASFGYQAPNWIDRKAGDNTTNPLPVFVGNRIEDIIIFQNRLAVLSGDQVTLSSSGDAFNFFRDTVTQLLSKHPCQIRSTSTLSSRLRFFAYHNRDLIITTKRQQYKVSGKQPITPQTASMELVTQYNASETVAPVSIGRSVYLPNHFGEYLNVNKYDGATEDLVPDSAKSITYHVRRYITGTVNMLTGLPNHGLLFAASDTGQEIFVCNWDTAISRAERKRFAWFKWDDLSDDANYQIHSIETVKNTLLVVIETTQGLNLLKMDMDAGASKKYLDYQVEATGVTTTVTLGTTYGINESEIVVVQGTGCPDPGDYVGVTSLTAGVLTLDESMLGGTVYIGREFQVEVVPNLVTVRDEGGTVQTAANLRIQKFWLRVVNTGIVEATEQSPYDTYDTQEFSGLISNDLDTITDTAVTTEDDFKVGFKQKADVGSLRIHTKSWLPMTISQIDWFGNYTSRGRRF